MDDLPPPAQDGALFLAERAAVGDRSTSGCQSVPDRYIYDPSNPTPACGGPLLSFSGRPARSTGAGKPIGCADLHDRSLTEDIEVIGSPRVELYVRSTLAHTDFVARLCDVQPDGRSINLCDGFVRLTPGQGEPQPDGSLKIAIELWPTANCFQRGHRLRLQVCSGGHPRWSRNLGRANRWRRRRHARRRADSSITIKRIRRH